MTTRITAEEIDRALEAGAAPLPTRPLPNQDLIDWITTKRPKPSAARAEPAGVAVRALLRLAPEVAEDEREARERARRDAMAGHRQRVEAARAALEGRLHPQLLRQLRARPTPSALLLGPTGVGKTSAALWLRAGMPGEWFHARDLASCERRHPLGGGSAPALERACSARVLYLDDLGTEDARDIAVLQQVLERRYAAVPSLPTVTTTGLTRDLLTDRYGAATVRRLTDQHVPRRDGSRWPVLVVDLHQLGGAA